MPRPSLRSRSFRRIKKKVPGGASVIHYLKRRPSQAKCAICGGLLHGVASERGDRMKKMAKSKKVPSRMFGGNLCPSCTKNMLKKKVREKDA